MPILSDIIGKWNLISSENFDEYMKEVGVGFVTRKMAASLKPVLDFTGSGDEYTMTSTSTFTTHVTKFKLGQPVDVKTADGREVTSVFSVVGDKLIQEEKGKNGGKDSRFERFIEAGKLVITCSSGSVTCTRKYAKA